MHDHKRKKPGSAGVNTLRSVVLGCVLLCSAVFNASAETMRAVYFMPKAPGDIFGDKLAGFMRAVAADLDVTLEIVRVHTESSLVRNRQTLEAIQKDKNKIDIALLHYDAANLISPLSELAGSRDFVIVSFNSKPPQNDLQKIGPPREQHPRWIAYLAPDDSSAGYQLAHELVVAAKTMFSDASAMHLVATGGNDVGEVSSNRLSGMQRRLQSESGVAFREAILTDWRREQGYKTALHFTIAHPQAKIFWAASDELALGVIDALTEKDMQPGRDFVTGGIDWSDEGIKAVADGKMVATVGGHFMEGGWALLLAFDYLNGRDFADDLGVSIATPMHTLTRKNVAEFAELLSENYWQQLDFSRFSKALNPNLQKYDFSLDALTQSTKAK